MTGLQLSQITHESGTPWDRIWEEKGRDSVIPDSVDQELLWTNLPRNQTGDNNDKVIPEPIIPEEIGKLSKLEEELGHDKRTSEHRRAERFKDGIGVAGLWFYSLLWH